MQPHSPPTKRAERRAHMARKALPGNQTATARLHADTRRVDVGVVWRREHADAAESSTRPSSRAPDAPVAAIPGDHCRTRGGKRHPWTVVGPAPGQATRMEDVR